MVLNSGRHAGAVACVIALWAAAAHAQPLPVPSTAPEAQVGFIGGASFDPEQGFAGVFWRSPEIAGRFHLRPGIEGGFGNGLRLATINLDVVVRLPLGASRWSLVQGGGPAVAVARVSAGPRGPVFTDVGAGASYLFGFAHDGGLVAEMRVGGGGHVPNLKLGVGFAVGF